MSPLQIRDEAIELAVTDPAAAAEMARGVRNHPTAAQILGTCARFAPDDQVQAYAEEAFERAGKSTEMFHRVAASAWPLRALIERGQATKLKAHVKRLLALADAIPSTPSKSEALYTLLHCTLPAGKEVWSPILKELAALKVKYSRPRENARDAVLTIARVDPKAADYAMRYVQDERLKAEIKRLREERRRMPEPREFFPTPRAA